MRAVWTVSGGASPPAVERQDVANAGDARRGQAGLRSLRLLRPWLAAVSLAPLALTATAHADEDRTVVPSGASEGPRDLPAMNAPLANFARTQRYGAEWRKLLPKSKAPAASAELGASQTHEGLDRDPIEMQVQARYAAPGGPVLHYGFVTVAGQRVFEWGRLRAVEILFERAGRAADHEAEREKDVLALQAHFADPVAALGLGEIFRVSRNDLKRVEQGAPIRWPLRIELRPKEKRS